MSNQAIYILRTLGGSTNFGNIDYCYMKAEFWKRNDEDVKRGIKRLMENDYVFEEIKSDLIERFIEFFKNKFT